MNANVRALIVREAIKYGVDPEVALRVAMGEGGLHWGAVGDHGTSFGPYQEHIGGALGNMSAQAARRFANSVQGVDLAMRGIASATHGAGGQQGVAAAVRGFERPAAPGAEIARDMGYNIGAVGHGGGPGLAGERALSGGAQMGGLVQQQLKRYEAAALMQNAAATAAGQSNPVSLMSLVQARQQATAAQKQFGAQPASGVPLSRQGAAAARSRGGVAFVGDTSGVKGSLLSSISQAAAEVGATKVRVTSGRRSAAHNAAVGGVTHSNHLSGDALDGEAFIPGRGWVPLGSALRGVAGKYGLRSGDVPGFFNGARDPVHVDDGANQG